MSERRLDGKVAIITGASRGLGRYCAIGYGSEGASVVVAARTEQQKDPNLPGTIYETAKEVEAAGGQALPVVFNAADPESIAAMVEATIEAFGRIDILMNNAAVQPPGRISTIQPKHWELEFAVNVHGPFHCTRAVLPTMLSQSSGSIINISSVAAQGGSHYGATKRAVEAMTVGLSYELRDLGIAVNALKPVGAIDTPGLRYRGAGTAPVEITRELPSPDSYVEAAVLLALATPASFTGRVVNDAEAVAQLADEATRARLTGTSSP